MSKVIVASPPIWGETAPLLTIAEGLFKRGHAVTVLTGSRFRKAVEQTGARFIALEGIADYDDRDLATSFPGRSQVKPGPAQIDFDMSEVFIAAMPDQYSTLQALLQQDPDSILVANQLYVGAWPAYFGAPAAAKPRIWVSVACNPLTVGTDQATIFGPIRRNDGSVDVQANREANTAFEKALSGSTNRLRTELAKLGATAEYIPSFFDGMVKVPDHVVALSVPELEFDRTDLPESVTFAGPIALDADAEGENLVIDSARKRGKPIIVVTQGTVANADSSQLLSPAIEGLSVLDVTTVAALGRRKFTLPVPSNTITAEWVPFPSLLQYASVFVTNGGFGGVKAAINAGVPIVVAGATEDKLLVAARVRESGCGIDLGQAPPTATNIADAVRRILLDQTYQRNSKRIQKRFHATNPIDNITNLFE